MEGQNNSDYGYRRGATSVYVPVGSKELQVSQSGFFPRGRPCVGGSSVDQKWITSIGCNIYGGGIDALGWKPGDTDLLWDRTVTAVAATN